MSDDINKKVLDLFSKHKKHLSSSLNERVKYYAGFNYVKLKKDGNGKKFNSGMLLQYSEKCHYIVRVMRTIDGETLLYNYDVPNNELYKFLKSFEENTLDGKIIEVDKYIPDDLA